jgi:hypothetical protein
VIVVMTGKATPVQAGVWLLPLIALVGLKWRDYLIWAGVEATYFVAVWLYIAGLSKPDRGLPMGIYVGILLLRVTAWFYVLVRVWRVAASRPAALSAESQEQESVEQESPVQEPATSVAADQEQDEDVDSLAGPMGGAPDRVIVRVS